MYHDSTSSHICPEGAIRRNIFFISILGIILIATAAWRLNAQSGRTRFPNPLPSATLGRTAGTRRVPPSMMEKSYERMKQGADQILTMSRELKNELESTNEDKLSLDIMKNAETIEKLAKDFKNRMKDL